MYDTTLGRVARLGDKTAFENYLSALEKWSEIKKVKYNKDKSEVLHLKRRNKIVKYA